MKKHWLDKPILRDLFWFLVLPHRLKMFVAAQDTLPPEMEKVLHENLWDLYEIDTPKVGDGTTAHNALGNRRAAFGASVLTDGLAVNGKE